jgi:activator of HSP90 ATPase
MPEAEFLYDLAIKKSPSSSLLFVNRSITRLKLGKFEEAKEDANQAISLDPSNLKAYFRLAQAHEKCGEFEEGLNELERGLALEPNNKAFLKEQRDMRERWETYKVRKAEEKERDIKMAEERKTARKPPAPILSPPSSTSSSSTSSSSKSDDLSMRGYRTTADGKKTTYFNNDLTEEERALIGDITPKRIDPTEASLDAPTNNSSNAGSAWNSAGTWENKDVTSWAKDFMKRGLKRLSFPPLMGGGVTLAISKVKVRDEGHAEILMVRGKVKHIADLSAKVHFSLSSTFSDNDEEESGLKLTGTFILSEISADDTEEFESIVCDQDTSHPFYALFQEHVRGEGGILQSGIHEFLRTFSRAFREK